MQKTTLLTLSITFVLVLPAAAQLGRVWTDFQSYSTDFQNYVRNNLSETLKPVEPQTRAAINSSTGSLNLPNPITAGQRVSNDMILNTMSDRFENNPVVGSTLVSNEIDRLMTRGAIMSLMGPGGQLRSKVQLENIEIALKNISALEKETDQLQADLMSEIQSKLSLLNANPLYGILANLAAGQTNLQLQSIRMQREQSKMLAETLAQTIHFNQFLQYSNLNLANISEQVEQTNQSRRVEDAAEAARLLRTASQMDLFGRETEN